MTYTDLPLSRLPMLPDPVGATVAAMHDGCRRVEQWMIETDDLAALDEARQWLAAVETYLEARDAQGPAQTTARLLEDRIGEVLGPAQNGGMRTSVATEVLSRRSGGSSAGCTNGGTCGWTNCRSRADESCV